MADVYEAAQYVALGPASASHDKSATGGPGKKRYALSTVIQKQLQDLLSSTC